MPKFAKGSPEAKAFMAKLRSMRGKGSFNSAALKGGKSYNSAALKGGRSYNSAALKGGRSYNSAALKGGIAPAVAALAPAAIELGVSLGKKAVGAISNYFRKKKEKKRAAKQRRIAKAKAALEEYMPVMKANRDKMKENLELMRDRINSLKEAQG